jgi:hypothetical protein
MRTHIYAFGSICRGEVTPGSDVDLLACAPEQDRRFDREVYSVYTHDRIEELWKEGNPFAWHLSEESKLIYSSDGQDYILGLGKPSPYRNAVADCEKFYLLFNESRTALFTSTNSKVFNLSSIFLSIRNIATCYSIACSSPIFSRNSAFLIDFPVPIRKSDYALLERSRILATRGLGVIVSNEEAASVLRQLDSVEEWMRKLICKVRLL